MTQKYYRLDRNARDRFRVLESHGRHWRVNHYFQSRDQLPEWLKKDPPLDLSALDLRFSEKPKAKKIPQFFLSLGNLFVQAVFFDASLRELVLDYVTLMPVLIGETPYYIVRPDVEIECVDAARSNWRQRDDGYRYTWPRLVLKDVPADAPPLFRPGFGSEFWGQDVFSEEFVEICHAAKVIGAEFEEVYPLLALAGE